MTTHTTTGSEAVLGISVSEARRMMVDLKEPNPWIYWADLLVSITLGATAFMLCPLGNPWSVPAVACVIVSALAFYRAALFVHELVHAAEHMRFFSLVWHLLCGIPLLIPKFTYEFHQEHHASRTYGTEWDGGYVDYADQPRWRVLLTPFTAVLGLPVFVLRFLVLAPVSWVIRSLRPLVLTRASTLAIDAEFVRKVPEGPIPRHWIVQETACFVYSVAMMTLLITGVVPVARFVEAYVVITVTLFVNWCRVLVLHRYEGDNQPMSFPEQVLDSIDHTSFPLLAELWAPLGLRYHAVHHFIPWLPYHALPEARRRLSAAIPADGGYWHTTDRSWWTTVRRLLSRAPREATGGGR